jgi:hypothetical protein
LLFLIEKERIRFSEDERRERERELRRDREGRAYGTPTSIVVAAFRRQNDLGEGELVDERTADALNQLLQESGGLNEEPGSWVLKGQVFDAGGPINGIHVDVFDRDLFFRRENGNRGQLLNAETQITRNLPPKNEDGCFEFTYTTNDFVAGDIPRDGATIPDLVFALSRDGQTFENLQIFRLPDGQQLTEELAVSDDDLKIGIQARKIEVVRIVIDGGKPRRELSEYELLLRAIAQLLPGSIPADADDVQREAILSAATKRLDEKEHRDISFVARETGFENHIIDALVAAFSIAGDPFQNQLRPFIFYGLARTCVALDVLTLGRLSTDETRAGLTEATAGTHPIIPPFDSEDRLKETVRTLRELLEIHLPQHRPATGGPSLADLMGANLPDTKDLATLWRTYSDHQGIAADFWTKLEAQPGFAEPGKIAKVKYAFKLGALVQDNLSLINAVRSKHPAVVDTKELAFNLDTKEKWETLLTDVVRIPDNVPGKPEERKSNYAASLAAAMQVAHPTVVVANMVAALPADHLANQQSAVAKFLTDAVRQADFDLIASHIDELVSSHGDVLLSEVAIKDRAIVIDQVKRLQRLFRLSTGPESMKVLLDAGFSSAREVASLPPEIAIEMLAPKLGEAAARIIVNRASNISAAAISQYVFLNDSINGEVPGGAL